jgi:5'-3' exoribonuclease 2
LLISIWRDLAAEMDDYVTKDGFPDMRRVQQILSALASREAGIFKKRKEVADRQAANRARREAQNNANKRQRTDENGSSGPPGYKRAKETTDTYTSQGIVFFDPKEAQSKEVREVHRDIAHVRDVQSNKSAAQKLKELMKAKADGTPVPSTETPVRSEPASESASDADISSVHLGKRKVDEFEDADNGTPGRNTPVVPEPPVEATLTPRKDGDTPEDTVMLWEDGKKPDVQTAVRHTLTSYTHSRLRYESRTCELRVRRLLTSYAII